ncbi:MAG: hypothetical protein GX287_05355 [Fusobacteria bacterium]|nr:hypothetical protein [Fusobacteriota bacterium]
MLVSGAYGGAYFKNVEQRDGKKDVKTDENLKKTDLDSTDKTELTLSSYSEQVQVKQREIANENTKAATSEFDISKFKQMVSDISTNSSLALDAQAGKISQSRILEVLQNE